MRSTIQPSATTLWRQRYDGPAHSTDEATALAVSPDPSAVFVTGYSFNTTSISDYATVAYAVSSGSQLWMKRYARPAGGVNRAIAARVSPDGSTVYVTGSTFAGGTANYDYGTVAYDASDGSHLWTRLYNGPADGIDKAIGLGVSPDGAAVIVTGNSRIRDGYRLRDRGLRHDLSSDKSGVVSKVVAKSGASIDTTDRRSRPHA